MEGLSMDPRKATASVSYNGKRIDTKLAEYLQSFSYTDVASGESDSLSLNINDRDRKWIKSWFPSKGDTMAATIIMKNWSKEGDTQKLSCGSFVIDDFSFSGTPVKLKLEALALPADSSFKETQRTKTYEKTTLENIGQEVAKRAGIKLYYEAPRIPIEKVEQSEKDDCSFYNELVKLYGFA
jgi:phage protein D